MRSIFVWILVVIPLLVGLVPAQDTAPMTPAEMRERLKQATDLEPSDVQKALEPLTPLLAELRRLAHEDRLTEESVTIYQDALLLLIRTQTKLLVDEAEIASSFRELLWLNPHLDVNIFNPRERLLLDKVRSRETGRLTLLTSPPGATLTHFGISLGTTPVDISLISGSYRLALKLEGYRDQAFEAVIQPSEILTLDRTLRRRTIELPLSFSATGVSVAVNGSPGGVSQGYQSWIASLSPAHRQQLQAAGATWAQQSASSYIRLSEIAVGTPLALEFRAPCYQPLTLNLTVPEQQVDWEAPFVMVPELRRIELVRDTGFMEITSSPPGAEVFLDGVSEGRTPLARDVCVGTHRVQVLHPAGQYVEEVIVRRGQASRVSGELRPALAFLGVYGEGTLDVSAADTLLVARRLALRMNAFVDPHVSTEDIATLRKKGMLPIEELLTAGTTPESRLKSIAAIAARTGHVETLLFGTRAGDKFAFRLYGTIQPEPDLILIPNLAEASLDFLVNQINRAEGAGSRLQRPHLELDLLETARGLVVLKDSRSTQDARAVLAPGTLIRSVDQKKMSFSELKAHIRSRKPGQPLTFEVSTGKETSTFLPVSVVLRGAEYPWNAPDGLPNAVMAILRHLIERNPEADEARYASLGLARGLMLRGNWTLALQFLTRANLATVKSGISQGTVLYYQGRCYEELGDAAQAVIHYTRAKEYPDATMGTIDGLPIADLAERRIQVLQKKRSQ